MKGVLLAVTSPILLFPKHTITKFAEGSYNQYPKPALTELFFVLYMLL